MSSEAKRGNEAAISRSGVEPVVRVLPDAGPEEMARSSGVRRSVLEGTEHRRVTSGDLSVSYVASRTGVEERLLGDKITPEAPGSRMDRGITQANIDYHGESDPDA